MKPVRFQVTDSAVMSALKAGMDDGHYHFSLTTPFIGGNSAPMLKSDYGGIVFASKWSLFSFTQNGHPDIFLRNKIQSSIEHTRVLTFERFARANNIEVADILQLEATVKRIDSKSGSFGPNSLSERLAGELQDALLAKPVVSFLRIAFNADRSEMHTYEVEMEAGYSFVLDGDSPSLKEGECVSQKSYAYPDTQMAKEDPQELVKNLLKLAEELCSGVIPRKKPQPPKG